MPVYCCHHPITSVILEKLTDILLKYHTTKIVKVATFDCFDLTVRIKLQMFLTVVCDSFQIPSLWSRVLSESDEAKGD